MAVLPVPPVTNVSTAVTNADASDGAASAGVLAAASLLQPAEPIVSGRARVATAARGHERIVRLGMLATIGSVSPFVGLFGTVWGIMNSFSAIAARHDTTLAVVAPGIAEALFATAMGLLAAIPAVIFYNRFVAEIGRYVNLLDAFSDEFFAILSRQLDEKVPR